MQSRVFLLYEYRLCHCVFFIGVLWKALSLSHWGSVILTVFFAAVVFMRLLVTLSLHCRKNKTFFMESTTVQYSTVQYYFCRL